jgi:hypothetical protein
VGCRLTALTISVDSLQAIGPHGDRGPCRSQFEWYGAVLIANGYPIVYALGLLSLAQLVWRLNF